MLIRNGFFSIAVCFLFSNRISSAQAVAQSQISKEEITVNRDPVISDTGLIAWMYYGSSDTNETGSSAISHIAAFKDDKLYEITSNAKAVYGASKPTIAGDHILFVANALTSDGDITWVLREVAARDEGDIKELPASYEVSEEDGEQRFVSSFGTNAPANAEDGEIDTENIKTNAVRRSPSGRNEIWSWRAGDSDIQRVTHDTRNDFAPSHWGNVISWQKAKGWPFGWEIMALVDDTRMQLTTNYYYDMGPKVHGDDIVWYGWDGFDYEIYLFDTAANTTVQITSNRFDDVAPAIWDGVLVWEGYSAVEADIFMWNKGEITKISDNLDDDLYPRIWKNKVVWQGFDGDDFELYAYEIGKSEKPIKLTTNNFDDTNPEIFDDLITWMGYHENWDAEIFFLKANNLSDSADLKPMQLTTNEEDDRDPRTAGGRIVWVSEVEGATHIMLAEP